MLEPSPDWVWIYKFARQALLFTALAGIALYLYWPQHRERLEARKEAHDEGRWVREAAAAWAAKQEAAAANRAA